MFHTAKHPTVTKSTLGFSEDHTLGITSTKANEAELLVNGSPVVQWGAIGSKLIGVLIGAITQSTVPALGDATTTYKGVKKVTAIADATATAVLTVTIPNAAHSAQLRVRYQGELGAGGAVGAGEAVAGGEVLMSFTRTAGVASVINIGTAFGTNTAAVAGATTVTATIDNAAVAGGNTVAQTFSIRITITKGGGASANHTALIAYELDNLNASGVTVA